MRYAHLMGFICSGHGCYPPRPNVQGSPNVFVHGIPWHRRSDAWGVHCCPPPCHASVLAGGSSTVFANGLGVARIGDAVACGSVAIQCVSDVTAGG